MKPEVQVDAVLAVRAAEVAASRGERIEDVVERALRTYVGSNDFGRPNTSGDS